MKVGYLVVCMACAWLVVGVMPAVGQTWVSYDDIGPDLLNYQSTYPSLCTRYDLGLSVEGRHLWAIRISDNVLQQEDEPEVKYVSTMHGDEIVGVTMCMYLIDDLLTNYGADPQITSLVDEADIWIVPLMNPDGYSANPRTRENANDVDLNRDFPNLGDPDTTAGRAIETANIMNWVSAHTFTVSANFHGGSLVVNYPFDNEDSGSQYTPDNDLFVWISEEYSQHNLPMWNSQTFYHGITNGVDWYSTHGSIQDWNYNFKGCNDVTIEQGDTKEPPASQIGQYWSDNRDAMLAYLETALVGVRGLVTDGLTGAPLAATITVVGRNHEIYTDPDVGDYHRMLMPGTYDLTFQASGYDTLTVSNVVVNSGDATRLDIQMYGPPQVASPNGSETLTANVPTTVSWTGSPNAQFHVQYTATATAGGTVTDDFETGALSGDYTTGGDATWYVASGTAHGGSYAARAGAIGKSQNTWMTRSAGGGALSFWYRVSSETNYDFFDFYIDGVRKVHVSGSGSWTEYTDTLAEGTHELKWEYVKDWNTSSGSDTAWVDDLQIVSTLTEWYDIVPLTAVGATSTPWTPTDIGDDYKVRVRSYASGAYGDWDESDAVFSVAAGSVPGDYDGDGDVDLDDFASWDACMTGPDNGPYGGGCEAFDFDADNDVDLEDFAAFVLAM